MPPSPLPLVVLTPIRNEGWILDRFLAVTTRLADQVILADQGSTDESRTIAARYPNVTVIANPDTGFSEATRQGLLIDEARRLVPGPKVLLALDADEIIAADAPTSLGWQTMRHAAPGTVLCFELIDLLLTPDRCMRHDRWRPFGYVDDGAPHQGRLIHSGRIPLPAGAPRLKLNSIKLLHYAPLRTTAMASKLRWYSVMENVLGSCPPVFKRRLRYLNHVDFTWEGRIEASQAGWFDRWEVDGIDMQTVDDPEYHWYDVEVLRAFQTHGSRKFWLDDIWRFDWEPVRQWAIAQGFAGIPSGPVRPAPDWLVWVMRVLSWAHRHQVWIRQRLSGRRSRRLA
ncbi:MAG: glycosyltransferase family 2 protein [Gemmatimonadales bacterium]|nr:glycosyltransferase family 2 protein [Gemmatimonadales bacterium]